MRILIYRIHIYYFFYFLLTYGRLGMDTRQLQSHFLYLHRVVLYCMESNSCECEPAMESWRLQKSYNPLLIYL